MMSQPLQQLVAALPEVYQGIYGHPEWDLQAARDCLPRLEVIGSIYDRLCRQMGRPLRVLDLGCAQGFFSLSLASKGAVVTGIDFQKENISVCRALAEENPDLLVTFHEGRIEEVIEALQPEQYDMVLGLSVFHHIVHQHGLERVKSWLGRMLDHVHMAVFEVALKEEPLYWGPSQANDPRSLVDHGAFCHQLAAFGTHLSHINRPMFVVSNTHLLLGDVCKRFDAWRNYPYRGAELTHNGSRRYYFGDGFVCKLFDYAVQGNSVPMEVLARNQVELGREVAFLQHPPVGFTAPQLIAYGHDERQGWLVMERLEGELLSDVLVQGAVIDADKVLADVLRQVVALESAGLYHDDIRAWNVLYDNQGQQALLLDYGSIGQVPQDCVWPHNIFQAFFIFVNELLLPGLAQAGTPRPALLSPFHLPQPYANWLYAFWQTPVFEWSFTLLAELFARREQLPNPAAEEHGFEAWLKAQELQLLEQAHRDADLSRRVDALDVGHASLARGAAQVGEQRALLQQLQTWLDEQRQVLDELRAQQGVERLSSLELQLKACLGEQQQLFQQLQIRMNEQQLQQLQARQIEEERLVSLEQQCQQLAVIQQHEQQQLLQQLQARQSEKVRLEERLASVEQTLHGVTAQQQAVVNKLNVPTLEAAQALEDELNHLRQENVRLARECQVQADMLQAIYRSRSWRMTGPYRYLGLQLNLLNRHGLVGRSKHLLKRLLKASTRVVYRHPKLEKLLRAGLRTVGLHGMAKRVYYRIYPLSQGQSEGDGLPNGGHTMVSMPAEGEGQPQAYQQQIESAPMAHADRIYAELKTARERLKGKIDAHSS